MRSLNYENRGGWLRGKVHAFILTGKGPRDIRIMSELASKYNLITDALYSSCMKHLN